MGDIVITCFFIDTAQNLLDYIEVIYGCLRKSGCWINIGPLSYHWSDAKTYLHTEELSIELALHDIVYLSTKIGFSLMYFELVKNIHFSDNTLSMLHLAHRCALFTMKK